MLNCLNIVGHQYSLTDLVELKLCFLKPAMFKYLEENQPSFFTPIELVGIRPCLSKHLLNTYFFGRPNAGLHVSLSNP